jgi:hypothetical protein
MKITGMRNIVPIRRKACPEGALAASQSVNWCGTMYGNRLIARPR